jgi:branched-subunit amino acid aminotransferase/4-amino-4-deoxychorismate lyase
MMRVVSINGRLVPRREARVSVADGGFLHGEGVFETIRLYQGKPLFLRDHLERLAEGARLLGLASPAESDLLRQIRQLVRANRARRDKICRLSLSRAPSTRRTPGAAPARPTRVLTLRALPEDLERMRTRGISARTVPFQRAAGPSAALKSLSYLPSLLALRAADLAGAAEALFVTPSGHVLEGATTNVFAVLGERITTPPADGRLVPGILRRRLLALARGASLPFEEAPLPLASLEAAREIFVTNAAREILPVVRVDGRTVGTGRPGPATRAVQAAWRAHVASLLGGPGGA